MRIRSTKGFIWRGAVDGKEPFYENEDGTFHLWLNWRAWMFGFCFNSSWVWFYIGPFGVSRQYHTRERPEIRRCMVCLKRRALPRLAVCKRCYRKLEKRRSSR